MHKHTETGILTWRALLPAVGARGYEGKHEGRGGDAVKERCGERPAHAADPVDILGVGANDHDSSNL